MPPKGLKWGTATAAYQVECAQPSRMGEGYPFVIPFPIPPEK